MRARRAKITPTEWSQLLVDAVNAPGIVSSAYSRFWSYSIGNQLLAIFECMQRGLEPGPINTFKGWLALGRSVKKGERGITLCMPLSVKQRRKNAAEESVGNEKPRAPDPALTTIFVYKPHWFVLSQTDGAPHQPLVAPEWSEERALHFLEVERIAFNWPDGNCQGFARSREVAVSPIAVLPHKTLFHEVAHVVLGHTDEGTLDDHENTPRNIREVEAECVALICCEALGLPGAPESRGYIQHWLHSGSQPKEGIPVHSVQRIFRAADTILKAGRPCQTNSPE